MDNLIEQLVCGQKINSLAPGSTIVVPRRIQFSTALEIRVYLKHL